MTARLTEYHRFIERRSRLRSDEGFDPIYIPDQMFDFQRHIVEWVIRKGRAAGLQDCGLGKTFQQLVVGDNVVKHTNKPVILATPLAVGPQTLREAERFGIDAERSRDGKISGRARIVITNYEQLHKFDPSLFSGFVGDESSCMKNAKSERKKEVAEFTAKIRYRSLWTATAAPNDVWELGTSSEVLGYMGFRDMITTFFKQETSDDNLSWGRTKYRFRGHAEHPFWRWVCSWAMAIRKPSDIGFSDERFALPALHEHSHVVHTHKPRAGLLFSMAARNLQEQREERRNSIVERCEKAASIAQAHNGSTVLWGVLNDETDMLERMLPDAVQVKGGMSDEAKEERLVAFTSGEIKHLVTKAKIGCWGLNWQHCNNIISLPSHSYEEDYQLVRRCWRFGQQSPVHVHRIVNEGEVPVLDNIKRKAGQADRMFDNLVKHMNDPMHLANSEYFGERERIPAWL